MYPVTLSRNPLSYLLYRMVFFTLHPSFGWWVEDCIALCSCAAGVAFFWSLINYTRSAAPIALDAFLLTVFPASTLVFQIFCGHIEFYPWICASLMVSAYMAWLSIHRGISIWWSSIALMLSAGFHSSGAFYFPALLFLPSLTGKAQGESLWPVREEWKGIAITFLLFILTALFHRFPYFSTTLLPFSIPLYLFEIILGIVIYYNLPESLKSTLKPYWPVYLPWLFFFTIRAAFWLRAEPLFEHLPPLGEPYDHGAYLYEAFSRAHLDDKTTFHLWLMPFGLAGFFSGLMYFRKQIFSDRWLTFLFHLSIWAIAWSTVFYPQLRTRDWDLFASAAIPLNLFVSYLCYRVLSANVFRLLLPVMIIIQLTIAMPIVLSNSSIGVDRGYTNLKFEPKPVECKVFLRGLLLTKTTPAGQKFVRTGMANIRIVPLKRGHESWESDIDLRPGKNLVFDPVLRDVTTPPIPSDSRLNDVTAE